jgi:tRNA 2-selenouridine synthase
LLTLDYFHNLFLQDTPFLDVRSEGEFSKGSFPRTINYPILNDHERHLVGICYKQQGQTAAINLGHSLVHGALKSARIGDWVEAIERQPDMHLYCWRGGLRSNLAQQWLHEAGKDVPLIAGGYKALRGALIGIISQVADKVPMIRIGGKTGVAKSLLLNEVAYSVDLEKHANHRGSSFGRMVNPQPTQIDFENALAIDLIHTVVAMHSGQSLLVEDEGRTIGLNGIPTVFFEAMRRSPLVLVEMPLEFRVQCILQTYVIDMLGSYTQADTECGFQNFSNYLLESLKRIQKRLGLERYKHTEGLMNQALQTQLQSGSADGHEAWITQLLNKYYDPMYEYQISKNQDKVVFSGNYETVLDWVQKSRESNPAG